MEIQDLILRGHMLPDTIEDLLPLRLIGDKMVKVYREKVDLIEKLELGQEQRRATLADGQDAGKMLLDIEARIGKLSFKVAPAKSRAESSGPGTIKRFPSEEPNKYERMGLTKKQVGIAQSIHKHPEVVAEVIEEAEENEDIPTRTAVLNKIRYKQELERKEQAPSKTVTEMTGEALIYQNKLMQAINIIPPYPPKELPENQFRELKALAIILIKRLEVFSDGKT